MRPQTKTELEAEIKKLRSQLEEKKRVEQYDNCASEIYKMYTSFVNAGFNEKQAYELTRNIVNNGTTPKHSIF